MGDGDIETYKTIPRKYKTNVLVMKSGHHGAKDTISEEMVKNTELFIISTGKNIYNHPNNQTLEIINAANKKYLRTDENNAIKVKLGENVVISAYSPNLKKNIKLH